MPSNYPDSIDGYAQIPLVTDKVTSANASVLNSYRSAIINIENTLGINPQGEFDTVAERLDTFGAVNPDEIIQSAIDDGYIGDNFSYSGSVLKVVDLEIDSQQKGSILYFDGTNWKQLSPGTSGKVLTTNGAGADPTWETNASGTGDVIGPSGATDNALALFDGMTGKLIKNSSVSVVANGLQVPGSSVMNTTQFIGNVTTSAGTTTTINGTLRIPQSTSPNQTTEGAIAWDTNDDILRIGTGSSTVSVIANNTAAGGDLSGTYPNPTVSDLTMSGEVQGSVLYRNASNWTVLSPGTSGQVLTTNGAAADPEWKSPPESRIYQFSHTIPVPAGSGVLWLNHEGVNTAVKTVKPLIDCDVREVSISVDVADTQSYNINIITTSGVVGLPLPAGDTTAFYLLPASFVSMLSGDDLQVRINRDSGSSASTFSYINVQIKILGT